MKKRILHLTLKKKWFDLIASGKKTSEYREVKGYWIRRILEDDYINVPSMLNPKKFDEIHFRNGYNPNSPFMRIKYLGLLISNYDGTKPTKKLYFEIVLGEILEIKNWEKPNDKIRKINNLCNKEKMS